VSVPFSLDEAFENYVSERWAENAHMRQLTSRQLALFYRMKRLIPRHVQLLLRRMLIRWQGTPEFPRWPLDKSVHSLVLFYGKCLLIASGRNQLPFRWFWPDNLDAALLLTHDVESAEGLRLCPDIADLEEERGFRSSFNIVGRWYPIDRGVVSELRDRGFEIGVHGLYHNRSMFQSRESFEEQQPELEEIVRALGASGFRSPATHRVYEWLAELPVDYDCSIPHSDPFEPQPGGCCTVWPFFVGRVVELPYTLPQDHTLFTLLRHQSPVIWLQQLDRIATMHGLAQVLSHPDPGYLGDRRNRSFYVEFLDAARERAGLWKPLPRELAAWWRFRDQGAEGHWSVTTGVLQLDSGSGQVTIGRQAAYL
jgi:peptidoglycan/xylan/chitin deacetylase (PgdA/CDA1 family)